MIKRVDPLPQFIDIGIMDLRFYHLTASSLEQTLPSLLLRTLDADKNALVRFGTQERMTWYDDYLWTFDDRQFVPHGLADGQFASDQPVLLSNDESTAKNEAAFVFWADGFCPVAFNSASGSGHWPLDGGAERLCILFSGQDQEQLALARQLYKRAVSLPGVTPTYWKQADRGGWSQAA